MAELARDPEIPDLVSLSEAAEILGVTKQYVHQLAHQGDLLGAQVGERGTWVFRREAVKKLLPPNPTSLDG